MAEDNNKQNLTDTTNDQEPQTDPKVDKQSTQQPAPEPKKQTEKTFTQEEVDKIVMDRLNREKAKQKAELEKLKHDQEEAEKLKKMNADEKAKYQLEKAQSDAEQAQAELARYKMRDEARRLLVEGGFPPEESDIDMVVTDKAESTQANVKALLDMKKRMAEQTRNELLKGRTPQTGSNSQQVQPQKDRSQMSYEEMQRAMEAQGLI
ncbi:DUF4355 domain-containing protein [Limosilactobacillus gorillae]|uniref:DUF4355 domain-containing protein n=1 Tax=Limosilactobacillus gorillae TaxID=1450649 RepID=UPI000B03B454|nr:DUF4355 domain-containing protein [Limosilactobacillus gorillae]